MIEGATRAKSGILASHVTRCCAGPASFLEPASRHLRYHQGMGGATREALVLRNCRRKRPRGFASGGLLIVAVSCSPLLGDVDVDEASTDGRALGEEFLPAIPSGASA